MAQVYEGARVFFFFFVKTAPTGLLQKREVRVSHRLMPRLRPPTNVETAGSLELSPKVGPRKCDYARLPRVGRDDGLLPTTKCGHARRYSGPMPFQACR